MVELACWKRRALQTKIERLLELNENAAYWSGIEKLSVKDSQRVEPVLNAEAPPRYTPGVQLFNAHLMMKKRRVLLPGNQKDVNQIVEEIN